MKDLDPLLEEFYTMDGKCGSCRHRGGYSGWCFKKDKVVRETEECILYEGGRAE